MSPDTQQQTPDVDADAPVRVIKARDAESSVVDLLFERKPKIVKSRVVGHVEELERVVGNARREADDILEAARAEAERIKREARAEGEAQANRECLELIGEAQRIHDSAMADAEADLLDMAFGLARRIVGTSLELEPELIDALVRDVLRRARGKRSVSIVVHPRDAETLKSERDRLEHLLGGSRLTIEGDDALSRGSCVLRTESGDVDARLETRLDAIRRSIKGR